MEEYFDFFDVFLSECIKSAEGTKLLIRREDLRSYKAVFYDGGEEQLSCWLGDIRIEGDNMKFMIRIGKEPNNNYVCWEAFDMSLADPDCLPENVVQLFHLVRLIREEELKEAREN